MQITNPRLNERIAAFGSGISRLLSEESNVLLLLNDGLEFVIADLALAKHSIVSITLSSRKLLSRVLEVQPPSAIIVDADFLPHLLELIYDAKEHDHKIIVVGQTDITRPKAARDVQILDWAQVEADGAQIASVVIPPVHPSQPFTLAFSETPSGDLQGVRLTHLNFTSGVTAIRALFPPSIALSTLDTLVSGHSLSTPFGRAIAYTALYECASFATCDSTRMYRADVELTGLSRNVKDIISATKLPIPTPTVLFVHPDYIQDLSTAILSRAKKSSFTYPVAWRHKLAALAEGFLSKESLWDRMVLDGAREHVMGRMAGSLKAVVVSGDSFPNEALTPARIALSVPLINAHIHASTSGPVLATHAFDVQSLPSANGEQAHVGAPSINVEVKLVGVDDAAIEKGHDPKGKLLVRGPPVGVPLPDDANDEDEGWVQTGETAQAMTNGAFRVIEKKSK